MILFENIALIDPFIVLHDDDSTLRIRPEVKAFLASHAGRWTHDLYDGRSRFSFEREDDRDAFEAWCVTGELEGDDAGERWGDDEVDDLSDDVEEAGEHAEGK